MIENLYEHMNKSLDAFQKNLGTIRTGRASPSLLDMIIVECYGSKIPLNQVGSITSIDSSTLCINVWDRSNVKSVEKSILQSELGINPNTDGNCIILPIPQLNEERRKDLAKLASKYAENSKIAVRNIRRTEMDNIKDMKKNHIISEDEFDKISKEIQKYTDDTISKIDKILLEKEKDILNV